LDIVARHGAISAIRRVSDGWRRGEI
jgi:hypothetical protein